MRSSTRYCSGLPASDRPPHGAAACRHPSWPGAQQVSRAIPPRQPASANDNRRNAKPTRRYAFDICRAAARARWIGQVIVGDADEAIQAAAVEFSTDIKKQIAVPSYEIE
jgi:hypothetical protein